VGSTLRVEGDATCCSAFVTVANGFTNNGAIDLTAINGASGTSAQLTVTNGALTNAPGGTITSLPGTGGARTLTAVLANQGTLTVTQPLVINHGSAGHTNSGTVTVGANLTVNQSGTTPSFVNTGAISVAAADTFTVTSGTFTQSSGTIGGAGALELSSVNPATFSTAHSLAAIILLNTTVSFATAQSTAATLWSMNNATVNGAITFTNNPGQTLSVQGTTFNTAFDNQGAFILRASSSLNGALTTSAASSLVVQGDASCCAAFATVANGFTNNGVIDLTAINGASGTTSSLTVTNGSLTNASGATITSSIGTGGARSLTAALVNQGTVTVSQPLTINHTSAAHSNSGTLTVAANLTINQSGTSPSFTNTGAVAVNANDTLLVTNGAFTQSSGTLGGAGVLDLSSVNPATFSTAHSLAAIILLNTTAGFATAQATAATQWTMTNAVVNGGITFTNNSGQALTVQGTTFNTAFDNQGTLTLRASSALNGTFTTTAGSALVIQGDASCCAAFATVANGFTNSGTVALTAINGSGTTVSLTVTNGTLLNATTGAINVLSGTGGARQLNVALNNQGAFTIGQALTMSRASSVHANSGTITLNADWTLDQSGTTPSFTNTGTINLGSGRTWTVNGGAWTQSGGVLGSGGALVMNSVNPAAFNVAHTLGAITLNSTIASFALDQSTAATAFSMTNATVNGSITFTNSPGQALSVQGTTFNTAVDNQGTLTLRASSVLNGPLTTSAASALVIQGDASCCAAFATVANGFTNNGSLTLTAINGSGTTSSLTVTSGTLTNAGTLDVLAGNGGARTMALSLDNQGTMTVSQSATMSQAAASVVNNGSLKLSGGDLTITLSGFRPAVSNFGTIDVGANKLTVNGTGTFINQSTGVFMGSGTYDVSSPGLSFITDGKTIVGAAPGIGILTFKGYYLMGPTGSVDVEIGGVPNPGVTFDQLKADSVNLQGGTLNVAPGTVSGQTYPIILVPLGNSIVGDFQAKNGLTGPKCSSGVSGAAYLVVCP
jgi:hypothetical protein